MEENNKEKVCNNMESNIMDELRWRGLIAQSTAEEELHEKLGKEKISCYCGFDPSASSLHVGNFLAIMLLAHFQRAGHRPIALVGGATGMIGDPSGKSKERNLLNAETVAHNAECIKKQLSKFLKFDDSPSGAVLVNNYDWMKDYTYLNFLRDIGRYFRIGDMLAKESVKNRMAREEGISYTEFSYQILQAYDFMKLNEEFGCILELGGNDQWGNITAGTELIRRVKGSNAYGLTNPLITGADGNKLGKTVAGAVWLDRERTSPFSFYQFWLRTDDRDAVRYLKLFTFLEKEEIEALAKSLEDNPEKREAQKKLAWELTAAVHGKEDADKAVAASEVLFGGEIINFTDSMIQEVFSEVPTSQSSREALGTIKLTDLIASSGIAASKGAARKLIQQGGIYVNNKRESASDRIISKEDLASENYIVIRSGKKNYRLIRFE